MTQALQITAIPVLLLFGVLGCLAPRYIASRVSNEDKALQLGSAFSAGIFVGAGLLHLLPDAQEDAQASDLDSSYPISMLVVSVGFTALMAIELVAADLMSLRSPADDTMIESPILCEADELVFSETNDGEVNSVGTFTIVDPGARSNTLGPTPWVTVGLTMALSAHSVVAGLALGTSHSKAAAIFIAILAHKLIAGYALGTEIVLSKLTRIYQWAIITTFSISTPLGTAIGLGISDSVESERTMAIIKCLAAGTFLYIGGSHLTKEIHDGLKVVRVGWQLLMYACGFTSMALLALAI
eukprot:m.41301 g.41301  ORF g.41301 m.41301 type:complete len:298 (+) comp12824_c0_seq2:108-1001(+)